MPARVLIIVENEAVPFDSRVWKEARSLQEGGYQVTVLSPKGRGYTASHELLDGIHIYRHPALGQGHWRIGYLLEFASSLFWEFLFSLWIFWRHGFDVIQGCNPPDNIFLVALPFKMLGVKYIFDQHDAVPELYLAKYDRKGLLYWVQVGLEKLTYRFSDVVISTNLSYRDLAVSRGGLDPADVFVVRNGPDLGAFKPVPPVPALKNGKQYLVGYVGTMAEQDGLDILLDVALRVKELGRTDVRFTCVGGGPKLADLRAMVLEKGLADMVEFTGRISDEDLLNILSTADVCVNPDKPCRLNDISTMIKIVEYMALGKPIVQFESKEGRFSARMASLYADGRNPVPDFTAKLLHLLDNPAERMRMGEFGRRRVREELAWQYSVENLRAAYDRALAGPALKKRTIAWSLMDCYYLVKPLLPRAVQVRLRRKVAARRALRSDVPWPVWEAAGEPPPAWPGWPGGKRFALVLTHDVEGALGVSQCAQLADLEEMRGFTSSFGFVPLRYRVPEDLRRELAGRGFEVMVHDLYHDGKLFRDWRMFQERYPRINAALEAWGSRTFASGAMHHNLRWMTELEIDCAISTFDVDPFEPQACGYGRIFPFWVESPLAVRPGFVELPYTLPQDFTLFILLRQRTNAIWRQKLDWIAEKGGMVLVKSHPDYMDFGSAGGGTSRYPVEFYTDLLDYMNSRYGGEFWLAQPSDVARYWRQLGASALGGDNSIPARPTLCAGCRQAHADGWLSHYPRRTAAGSLEALALKDEVR
jgi:glycosyltransferase involved in cell wall biosynthesis